MLQANLFQKRVSRTYGGAPEAAPGWHAWYWSARGGTTRPGDDRAGPCSDNGRKEPGGQRRPGGTLLWGPRGQSPEQLLDELGLGYETVGGTPTALTRNEIRGVFGPEWLDSEAERPDDATITGAVRRHVLERLTQFIRCARATDQDREWTTPSSNAQPLATVYTEESDTLLIDAAAPHHPEQWPRTARIKLQQAEAPEIIITALGSGRPQIKVGAARFTAPLADIPHAVAVAVNDRSELRPRAPRTETLAYAGQILAESTARPISLTATQGAGNASPRRASREWLIETLKGYAIPREQGSGESGKSETEWEIDVRSHKAAGVLQTRNGHMVLTTERSERKLTQRNAASIREVAHALRTMWGAHGFWTDVLTDAVESIERPVTDGGTQRPERHL